MGHVSNDVYELYFFEVIISRRYLLSITRPAEYHTQNTAFWLQSLLGISFLGSLLSATFGASILQIPVFSNRLDYYIGGNEYARM